MKKFIVRSVLLVSAVSLLGWLAVGSLAQGQTPPSESQGGLGPADDPALLVGELAIRLDAYLAALEGLAAEPDTSVTRLQVQAYESRIEVVEDRIASLCQQIPPDEQPSACT